MLKSCNSQETSAKVNDTIGMLVSASCLSKLHVYCSKVWVQPAKCGRYTNSLSLKSPFAVFCSSLATRVQRNTMFYCFHGTSAAIRMCISLNPSLNHWNPALKKYDSGVHHLLGFEPKTNSPNPGRSMPQLSTKKRREGWSGAPAHEHRGILPGWNNSLGMDPNTVLKKNTNAWNWRTNLLGIFWHENPTTSSHI